MADNDQGVAKPPAPPAPPAKKKTHVIMRRDPKKHPAPHRAHVHVDEIENYAKGGFLIADGE